MRDATAEFYDAMAGSYHLLFEDWRESVARQAAALDAILRGHGVAPAARVLDCACGIGTQALGLARIGYRMTCTDLSAAEVERAKAEAEREGVAAEFAVADFRRLEQRLDALYDAVIAMDNALPHLLDDDDLRAACRSIRDRVAEGGLFMASVRDYDELLANKPTAPPPRVIATPDGRRIVFQIWDWRGDVYDFTQYIVIDEGGAPETRAFRGRYRALPREKLTRHLRETGFVGVEWLEPRESGYYQPIVVARKGT